MAPALVVSSTNHDLQAQGGPLAALWGLAYMFRVEITFVAVFAAWWALCLVTGKMARSDILLAVFPRSWRVFAAEMRLHPRGRSRNHVVEDIAAADAAARLRQERLMQLRQHPEVQEQPSLPEQPC